VEKMEKGEVIGKGRAAEVIYWGNNRVLKLFYKSFPSNIIDYQFKVDTLIGKIFPNCPKAFEKIEENGRIGIVYEYIEGIILTEFMGKKIKSVGKAIRMLAEIHVDMHRYVQRAKQLRLQYFEGLPEDKSSTNDKSRVYLDVYLGYGFTFRPDKITEEVFSFLSGCTNLISLDTPSGLDVTTGQFYSDLKPIATLTLAFVKIGLMIVEPKSIGELYIADIGVPNHIYEKELNIQWKSPYDIKSLKKLNEKFSQDSIQKVRINRHEDIMKSYWDII